MTILERVEALLEESGFRVSDLCKAMGIDSKLYYTWTYRKTEPAAKYIPKLADFFGVTERYIIQGESGRMTSDERVLLNHYKRLNDFGKRVLRDQLDSMISTDYYTSAAYRVVKSVSADEAGGEYGEE